MTQDQERELARQYGVNRHEDTRRGPGWCRFSTNNIHIWAGSPNKPWVVAELVNQHYFNHRHFDTLEQALANATTPPPPLFSQQVSG